MKWFDKLVELIKKYVQVKPIVIDPSPTKPTDPTKPEEKPTSCGCDLSRPLETPLVPALGNNDKEVDQLLYSRWKQGYSDNCGGLPGDVRPLLIRPAGKAFGWKDVILSGAVKIRLNGDMMTLWCGTYKGQRYHLVGCSAHEAPDNGSRPETLKDFIPMKAGVESGKKQFVYFEARKA